MPEDYFSGGWQTLSPVSTLSDNCRGIGPADMARCIREGGAHLTDSQMAYHVLDVIEQIMESGRTGQVCRIESGCERPEPFSSWKMLLKGDSK